MNGKLISLDTNILVYAVDKDAGERHERAMEIANQAADHACVLILQCLCEFYVAVTRKGHMPPSDAAAMIQDWQMLFPTASPRPGSIHKAIRAVRIHGLSFWDAMIWAVAKEAGIDMLLSEDFQHDRDIEGVRIINPFQVAGHFDPEKS